MDKINQIKKEIFMSMKMMDTTIKNIKESEEYKIAQAYNQGLKDAMAIFEREIRENREVNMDGLIDKFKIKDAIYNMRNGHLSDNDMEIWHLINELPVEMNKGKILEQMEALKDTEQDDSVAERVSTQI